MAPRTRKRAATAALICRTVMTIGSRNGAVTDLSTTQLAIEAAAAAALRAFAPVTAGTAGGPAGHRSGGCHLDAELHDCEIALRLLRNPQNLALGLLLEHLSLYDSKLRRHPQDFWV